MSIHRTILKICTLTLILTGAAQPILAQQQPEQVANSSVGQAGQRQTAIQTAPNVKPTGRIDNRIANRVQSRIYNRIDQYYNPQVNTLSPFVEAGKPPPAR